MGRIFGCLLALAALALSGSFALAAKNTFFASWPACGTDADGHLCITLTQAAHHNKNVTLSGFTFPGPLVGKTLATWSGTVSCFVGAETVSSNHFEAEISVPMQLRGNEGRPEIADEGAATAGFRIIQPVNFIHTQTIPVTLTRLFTQPPAGLFVRARPVFAAGVEGECRVTGGVFNWTVIN